MGGMPSRYWDCARCNEFLYDMATTPATTPRPRFDMGQSACRRTKRETPATTDTKETT
jgi:hypothetical protein